MSNQDSNSIPQKLSNENFDNEIKNIQDSILKESGSKSSKQQQNSGEKLLSLLIRRNRNNLDNIMKRIIKFLNEKEIDIKIVLNIINSIFRLLTVKSQIINFLIDILPFLFKKLTSQTNLALKESIGNTFGNLIKTGGIYVQRYVLESLDKIFAFFKNNEQKNKQNENSKFDYILLFCKIVENSPTLTFKKISETATFEIVKVIILNYKDPRNEVKYVVGELIKQLYYLMLNRASNSNSNFEDNIFGKIKESFLAHLKDNNDIPNDFHLISGFIEVLLKLKDSNFLGLKTEKNYNIIVSNLMKCLDNKVPTPIKVEFIKFIPELYMINREIFDLKYMKQFLGSVNKKLNIKMNADLRNAIILTLGSLSLTIDKTVFSIVSERLVELITELFDKKIFDVELLKCIADLLSNMDYLERVLLKVDFFFILKKIYKEGLSTYKIEFLISILSSFNNVMKEYIATVMSSLNLVSIVFKDEDFKFTYFYKEVDDKVVNVIDENLNEVLTNLRKNIRKCKITISPNNKTNELYESVNCSGSNKIKCLYDKGLMIYALTLFSQIEAPLFLKDMLIFYSEKILPFLLTASNDIKKKILELILCNFVKIYPNDENLSYYILNNILDAVKNLIFNTQDVSIRIYAFNILSKKNLFLDMILKEKESFCCNLIGSLSVDEDELIKEKIIKTIGILAAKTENKNYFFTFIKKNVINILFLINNNDDIIQNENLLFLLLYYTLYLKNFIDIPLVEKILDTLIELNINNNCQGIIFVNTLKIVYELLNNELINYNFVIKDSSNSKINNFSNILLLICSNNLREGGEYIIKSDLVLKVIYQIVKIQKLNIYQDITLNNFFCQSNEDNQDIRTKKLINKLLKVNNLGLVKINLANILIQCIIKGLNDESLKTIMYIFGLSGALDPSEMEKVYSNQMNYNLEGFFEQDYLDDKEYKIIKYNQKSKTKEEIDLSGIEPYTYKTILYLLKMLKENSQQDLTNRIVNCFTSLIHSFENKDENLIEIILPTFIRLIPQFEQNLQISLFNYINVFIRSFKKNITKKNLTELVQLCKSYIFYEQFSHSCIKILHYLFEAFVNEMEIYYTSLIQDIILVINIKKKSGKFDLSDVTCQMIIDIFTFMIKNPNINSYLELIINEYTSLCGYCQESDKFFRGITSLPNTYHYYPLIINNFMEKLKLLFEEIKIKEKGNRSKNFDSIFTTENKSILNLLLELFEKMNIINRDHFIRYLPQILKTFKSLGIIKYVNLEKETCNSKNEKNITSLLNTDKINFENCSINCIYGFPKGKMSKNKAKNIQSDNTDWRSNFNNEEGINRKNEINSDLIESFDISKCYTQEDWQEWFKSNTKVLFEQSSSSVLRRTSFLTDYYFPFIMELYNYAFFLAYTTINDNIKKKLIQTLKDALLNSKTPNEILLVILSLFEFLERKMSPSGFVDYKLFGKIAYQCKAYAKALYYKEKLFINKDYSDIEDLIELYHELKLPESAIGLLKLIQKNKEENRERQDLPDRKMSGFLIYNFYEDNGKIEKETDLEYKWHIKIHNYDEALKIISNLLENENDSNNLKKLKNARNECLNGLYDWEELINNYEVKPKYNYVNGDEKEKKGEHIKLKIVKEDIPETFEKELLLSKASMNLGDWDELNKHFSKIHHIFKGKHFVPYNDEDKKNEQFSSNEMNSPSSVNDDENLFFINHGLDYGSMSNKEKDFIYLNKYISNKRKKREQFLNEDSNTKITTNNKLGVFLSYQDLINNSMELNFSNNEETLFDLNLYSSVINIQDNNFNVALQYISEARELITSKIKALLNESYTRGYELLVKNQMLYNLEQIIEYKQNHFGNEVYLNHMIKIWDNTLKMIGEDPFIFERFLAIRSLVINVEKDFDMNMNLVKICRKLKLYSQSEKVLNRLKHQLQIKNEIGTYEDLTKNENHIKIDLSYNKCLFEKGDVDKAIEKSKYLVDLLEKAEFSDNYDNILCRIADKIKSKIYGNYAIYMQKKCDFKELDDSDINRGKNEEQNIINKDKKKQTKEKEIDIINKYFILSSEYNKNSFKLWHNFAMFNYRYYKYICSKNKDKDEAFNKKEIDFAKIAVNGFKNSLIIGGKNKNKTYQDILRLIDIFFSSGIKDNKLLSSVSETFNTIELQIYLNVIPQLICRFDLKEPKILKLLSSLLIKIGITYPHSILSSLIVMKLSNSKSRKKAADKIIDELINTNHEFKRIVEDCEMFITELNRCATLIHERWIETIEENARLYQKKDYLNFANEMLKFHQILGERPASVYEIDFYQKYYSSIREAEENLDEYKYSKIVEFVREAWEIYHVLYKSISDSYKTFNILSLDYISPKLYNIKDSNIILPGTYYTEQNIIKIKKIDKKLSIFNTKQHPRKITIIGNDDKEYMFLLKVTKI